LAMITTSSCTKDNLTQDYLTGTSCWTVIRQESRPDAATPWKNDALAACDFDNCYIYFDNSDYTEDEGASKCNAADPQKFTSTWSLSGDGKTITYGDNSLTYTETIERITADTLITIFSRPGVGDVRSTYTN
jgi:Lipocalin-like domain